MSNVFRPFLTVFAAVAIVGALSMFPWSDLTGRYFKDYNLLADLNPSAVVDVKSDDIIDPLLKEAMAYEQNGDADLHGVQLADSLALDSLQHIPHIEESGKGMINTTLPPLGEGYVGESKAAIIDGVVVLEDYTSNGTGLDHFISALDRRDYQPVRIAFIGDSYIEGDIFTQDVRAMLQTKFGGQGPGYLTMQSDITGFRRSVRQSGGEGWTSHDIRHKQALRPLSGEFFTANGATSATYKGSKLVDNARCWGTSIFMFSSPEDAVISYSTGADWVDYSVTGSDKVQCLRVDEPTESFSIKTNSPNMTGYGVWLGDWNGIQVDCMSLRGNSGLTHRELDPELASQMRKFIDYDMIVVEFGINALDSSRTDYSFYGNQMATVVQRLRQCYPMADIVLMGIGDRGQKIGSEVHSMPTAQHMVEAQRQAAKKSQCVFWDTRQAMGGENAIVSWRERNLVNGDFIHLNHKGGTALAKLFVDALNMEAYKD